MKIIPMIEYKYDPATEKAIKQARDMLNDYLMPKPADCIKMTATDAMKELRKNPHDIVREIHERMNGPYAKLLMDQIMNIHNHSMPAIIIRTDGSMEGVDIGLEIDTPPPID